LFLQQYIIEEFRRIAVIFPETEFGFLEKIIGNAGDA